MVIPQELEKVKPSELANYRWQGTLDRPTLPHGPVELQGCLLVSGAWSHLIDDSSLGNFEICYGVVVPEEAVQNLDCLDIPISGGTSVKYVGKANFICDVWQTGYPALPYRMTRVYEFTYQDKYVGKHKFKLHDIHRDLYVKVPKMVSAQQIATINKYTERKFSAMELKNELTSGLVFLVSRAINEEQQNSAKLELEGMGFEVVLTHVAVGNDWLYEAKGLL